MFFTAAEEDADCYLLPAHNSLKVEALSEVIPSFVPIMNKPQKWDELLGVSCTFCIAVPPSMEAQWPNLEIPQPMTI